MANKKSKVNTKVSDEDDWEWTWECCDNELLASHGCGQCLSWFCADCEIIYISSVKKCKCGTLRPTVFKCEEEEDDGEDAEEEKKDPELEEDGTYILQGYDYYLGDIPAKVTRKHLVRIFANGLVKLNEHHEGLLGKPYPEEKYSEAIDYWLEKADDFQESWASLVDPDDEKFEEEVLDYLSKM